MATEIPAAEALFSFADAISDGACWLHANGRLQPLNGQWFRLHGCDPDAQFPNDLRDYERQFGVSPEHPLHKAHQGQTFRGLDHPLRDTHSDEARLLRWSSVAVAGLDGRCVLIRAARSDAAQRAGLALLAGLKGINAALASKQQLQDLVQMVIDAGSELSGAQYAAFLLFDGAASDGGQWCACAGPGAEEIRRHGNCGAAALFGVDAPAEGVIRIDDLAHAGADAAARLPVRSYLAAAVVSGSGENLGALLFGHRAPNAFGSNAEEAIAALAAQAAIAIDHSRARQAQQRSEQHLLFALDAAQLGTWEWNRKSGRLQCSQIMARIHGFGASQTDQRLDTFLQQVHPEDREALQQAMQSALAERTTLRAEYRVGGTAEHTWVETTGRVVYDADDHPVGMAGVANDISERKYSEERFRLAVEASPSAIVMLDQDGRILLANRQVTQLFGYERASLEGESIERLLPTADDRPHVTLRALDDQVEASGGRLPEVEGRDVRGKAIPLSVGLNPIEVAGRRYVLCVLVDNSERKRAEENIRRVNEQLWRKHQEMEQFVYSVSHDLKSPLVTVTGFVGLLKEDLAAGNAESAADSVERIERATRRMSSLINDLLQLSRIGRVEIDRQNVSLQEVLSDLEHDLGDQIAERGAELVVQNPLPEISADRARVVEVLDNLVSNALKYGCREPGAQIHVGAQHDAQEVRVFVRDQGLGIPEEYQSKIFQPFQRLDNSTQGTGVGLAIVEKIMRTHGGRAWVESEPGAGATFWIAFPERPM